MDIFGTLGPSCEDPGILGKMFEEGMTGVRINLSHVMLTDYADRISMVRDAGKQAGIIPKILIDMQGPEIRIGSFEGAFALEKGADYSFGTGGIPVDQRILDNLHPGAEVLLDDGKILAEVKENKGSSVIISVVRGGVLTRRKSLAVKDVPVDLPALTDIDLLNLKEAPKLGVTGVMQPFVRNRQDLIHVRQVLSDFGGQDIRLYAKIENLSGIEHAGDLVNFCDEIVIARGDLGNAMPLWELPAVQKKLSGICRENNRPFMVVTQMLSSMENNPVPTRAEVSDIYNAVIDGASSVMVTGETAVGKYPVEVITYLSRTAGEAIKPHHSPFII
ncbi:MAG: pyruvate kinase [Lachnospiraceae bacterium]|nr:pyruvate kinase [Lachnospiraceae bacterium]